MDQWSLRSDWLKFKTAGNLQTIRDEVKYLQGKIKFTLIKTFSSSTTCFQIEKLSNFLINLMICV